MTVLREIVLSRPALQTFVTLLICASLAACAGSETDVTGLVTPDAGSVSLPDTPVTPPTGCTDDAFCTLELADSLAPCQEGRCGEDGACVVVVSEDGAECDDGAPCTEGDLCTAGVCGGSPRSCDDANACTVDSCDPKQMDSPCVHVTLVGGCDDGDYCTVDDVCSADGCAGVAVDCSGLNGDCTVGQCDPSNGACVSTLSEDGASCDDGVPCTADDQCTAGTCAGSVKDCSSMDSACMAGYCEPDTGECVGLLINEGGICEDGDACTLFDTCLDGACIGAAVDCSELDDACNTGACEEGVCVPEPLSVGTDCDDGDPCTAGDLCANGECLSGDLLECDDADPCNGVEVCDAETGMCASGEALECDDGNPCNGVEICDASVGGCVAGIPIVCDDSDPCNGFESCDASNGECVSGDPIVCDDGNPCDGVETCEVGTGACLPGAVIECDDDDPCNGVESCDGETGECLQGQPVLCDDTLPCNGVESCDQTTGECVAGEPVVCNDGDACNGLEACDGTTGECYAGAAPECDDGEPCNGVEGCDPETGACLPGDAPPCDDEDDCNGVETCDAETGECLLGVPVVCDDGLFCTGIETCDPDTGACLDPEPVVCDDGLPCNGVEFCDESLDDCQPGVPVDCGDDNPCDGLTACDDETGVCVTGAPPECGDDEPCNGEETCDPATGDCLPGPALDCDDGLLCTQDACVPGVGCEHTLDPGCECVTIADCAPFQTPGLCDGTLDCFDGICAVDPATVAFDLCETTADGPCEATGCDLETGECETLPDTGTACGDGDPCTVQDTCNAGVCEGAPRDCSYLDEPCATGVCQPEDGECLAVGTSDDAPCTNGDPCVEDEICGGGECGGGTALDCSGLNSECAAGECSASHGGCIGTPINEGGTCNDNDACTLEDSCTLGNCSGEAKECDVEVEDCNIGGCDPASGECVLIPSDEVDDCDDEDACTTEDQCFDGECVGTPLDCDDDAEACQVAVCDSVSGCSFTAVADGEVCDDGDGCTVDTTCTGGACAGVPVDCSSESIGQCEAVACDPEWGTCVVTALADETPCDDGDACTSDERCYGGACVGDAVECPGTPEVCAVHACDPASGECVATPVAEGQECSDGNLCTDGDVCLGGACQGEMIDCGGATSCAVATCEPESGGCVLSTYDDGTQCSDGNMCTVDDACSGGQCVGSDVLCESEESCTLLSCDATTGGCTVTAPLTDGSPCGDGSSCDGAGACQSGACVLGSPVQCSEPAGLCLVSYCDDTVGGCVEGPAVDGTECDDGDACTDNDVCTAGGCGGQPVEGCGAVPVLCEVSGTAGDYGSCAIHVARGCDSVPATGTVQLYFGWDPSAVQVVYFTDGDQDPSPIPPFTDPLYQTYPSYMGSFGAPGYYPTCAEHPSVPGFCLSYSHLYNTGPGDGSGDWPGNMTIFVYTDGAPQPIVDGVLDAAGQPSGDTLVFNLHYRLEADVDAATPVAIQVTEVVADDLDTVPFAPVLQNGVVVLDYASPVCP